MLKTRKGIVLAGGRGTRLQPLTHAISKQLMPVYDKPMVYYPLCTLMLSGIRDILIISSPRDIESFKYLLGNGTKWGISISYEIQKEPKGIAQAFILGERFLSGGPSSLILGDNLFYGQALVSQLKQAYRDLDKSTIFACQVSDPYRYGIVELDEELKAKGITEKPKKPKSNYAITGIYFYESNVSEIAKQLVPSSRGELEITDLNNYYLREGKLKVKVLNRGTAWLDAGTFDSLIEAGGFIQTLEKRQGLKIGCPEEIAWRQGWITNNDLEKLGFEMNKSEYGNYLVKLATRSEKNNITRSI